MSRKNFHFNYTFRVRYAEVDAQGIVFNAHYLTYFDCAITEYYRKIGYSYMAEVKKNKKDFHVVKTVVDYKKPIKFDQIIDACTRVSNIGQTSLTFEIFLFENKKNIILGFGEIIQVYADQLKKKSTNLPANLIKKIKRFENIN